MRATGLEGTRRYRATAARLEVGARYRTAWTRLAYLTRTDHADVTAESLEVLPATLPPSLEGQARTGQMITIDIFNVGSGLTLDAPLYEGGLLHAQVVQTAWAAVVDQVDARHAVLHAEHDVLDGCLRLAGARIDLLHLLAALEPDG